MIIKRLPYILSLMIFALALAAGAPSGARAADAADEEQLLYNYYSIFVPDKAATDARFAARRIAARSASVTQPDPSLVLLRVVRSWNTLSPEAREELAPYFEEVPVQGRAGAREVAQSSNSCAAILGDAASVRQSEHFTIHYTTVTSQDSVDPAGTAGTPSYISSILTSAEYVYEKEIEDLGFQAPPLADGRYHIYICDIVGRKNVLGLTVTNLYYVNNSAGSYLELDNDYAGVYLQGGVTIEGMIKVTMAHEHFHAIQFGLNWKYPSYWSLESTATWSEDYVFPDVNDYVSQYLPSWFSNTSTSLDHFSYSDTLAYGSAIFWKYISEKVGGPASMFAVWELIKNDTQECNIAGCPAGSYEITEISQIEQYLATRSTNLDTVFKAFTVANYKKDYVDGVLSSFPTLTPVNLGSLSSISSGSKTLDHLASHYYKISPVSTTQARRLSIAFSGNTSTDWGLQVLLTNADGSMRLQDVSVVSGSGSVNVDGFGTSYTQVILIVNNLATTPTYDDRQYSFTATQSGVAYAAVTSTRTFPAGWSLAVFPLETQYSDPSTAITIGAGPATIADNRIFYYNNTTSTLYDGNSLSSGLFKGLGVAGAGYWIYLDGATTLTLNGVAATTNTVDVSLGAGWSIFGNPFTTDVAWSDAKIAVLESGGSIPYTLSQAVAKGWLSGVIYNYSGTYQIINHNSGGSLQAWTGYWIEVKKGIVLRISR